MEGEEGLVVVRGRVEIDMRQPFRSVREAVTLFGEKILAGQVYGNIKLKQVQLSKGASTSSDGQYDHKNNMISGSKYGAAAGELEETKQSLQKAKEEGDMMTHCLTSLRQELEHTKRELNQIKMMSRRNLDIADDQPPAAADNIEELKFVSSAKLSTRNPSPDHVEEVDTGFKFDKQQKRSVKFASPPLLTKLITDDDTNNIKDIKDEGEPQTNSSKKKIKRKIKPLVPLIGGLFSRNKKLGSN